MNQYLEFISNHYLLSLAWVVVLYLLIQDLIENSFNKHKGLSPLLAVTKMNSTESVKVIDVREIHEYIKGHIEDSLNIPLSKLDDRLPELESLKSQPVIVVCHTGTRSIPACKTLIKAGFQDVYNIIGGMQSWEDNKLPVQITSKNKN